MSPTKASHTCNYVDLSCNYVDLSPTHECTFDHLAECVPETICTCTCAAVSLLNFCTSGEPGKPMNVYITILIVYWDVYSSILIVYWDVHSSILIVYWDVYSSVLSDIETVLVAHSAMLSWSGISLFLFLVISSHMRTMSLINMYTVGQLINNTELTYWLLPSCLSFLYNQIWCV